MDDLDKLVQALKYPDFHTWRDKSTIKNGYWPDGTVARISDPEFRPDMEAIAHLFLVDPIFREKILNDKIVLQLTT